jgi:SpoIID/LytB domain protein
VANQRRFQVDGYHLCADTQCQVYSDPTQAGSEVRGALQRSAGQVLTWKGAPLAGVYSASNGGVAAGFEEGWRGQALPYLRAFVDGPPAQQKLFPLPLAGEAPLGKLLREGGEFYGQGHPRYRWQRRLRAAELTALTAPEAIGPIKDLVVAQRGPSGRVQELVLVGAAGELRLQRDQIRRRLRMLPSTLFVLAPEGPGVWLLEGGGFGHGAGLSQAGAIDLAQRGWGSDRILQHYFPGSSLRPLKTLQPQGSP